MTGSKYGVGYLGELLLETDKKKFSFRRVKCEKVGRHPGGDMLKSTLKTSKVDVEGRWLKREKQLCVISIKVMIQ